MERLQNFLNQEFGKQSEIDINEMLSYELISPSEVWIHISDVRQLRLAQKLTLFRQGLESLAHSIATDPALAEVKKISGMSWIISKNSKLVQSLGFEVADSLEGLEDQLKEYKDRKNARAVHENDQPGYAHMSKEKLFELYGNVGV